MCAAAHGWFYDWQTLITGLLALLAGVVAVVGTLIAANRQVKTAQHQTEVMRDMERRRIAREGYAFYAMLEAAMGAVIDDVGAARELPQPERQDFSESVAAYAVRQRIKRAGFAELRTAFLRFGGTTLTDKFLRLDKEAEDFSSQCRMRISTPQSQLTGTPPQAVGTNARIDEALQRIEQQATELRYEAERGIEITRSVLGDDLA